MTTIMKAGARITSVDEEGYVSVFLYSFEQSFQFRVPTDQAKRWATLIGDLVTVSVTDEKHSGSATTQLPGEEQSK